MCNIGTECGEQHFFYAKDHGGDPQGAELFIKRK
jgi:hypothetical protein